MKTSEINTDDMKTTENKTNSFAHITCETSYKGHKIEKVESPMQIVFVIDSDREHAYWSIADAKRAINCTSTTYSPVDVRHWF